MKADPSAQVRLLDLQDLDSRADQLRHQRRSLAELAVLAELTTDRARLDGEARDARIAVDDLGVEQAKVDADVEQVKTRRQRDQQRIDQGLVSNPKDIQRMQQEMVSLERRITSLEDDEIEVMERLEDAQGGLDGLTAQLAETDEKLAAATASRDAKLGEIDHSLGELEAQRGPVVADVPADLLALYDRLRETKNGVGRGAPASPELQRLHARPRQRRARHDPGGCGRRRDPLRGVQPDPGPHLRERPLRVA